MVVGRHNPPRHRVGAQCFRVDPHPQRAIAVAEDGATAICPTAVRPEHLDTAQRGLDRLVEAELDRSGTRRHNLVRDRRGGHQDRMGRRRWRPAKDDGRNDRGRRD